MVETSTLLPSLFINKMKKVDGKTYPSCLLPIKSCEMEKIKLTNGTNVSGKRNREKYF